MTGPATAVAGPTMRGARSLLGPGEAASVGLLSAGEVVEDAYRGDCVIWSIDNVVGPEARNVADDRDRAFLDRAASSSAFPALAGLGG